METLPAVFLSSTSDMDPEYKALDARVPRLELLLVWFKEEIAQDTSAWSYCRSRISQCDIFLVVLGEKYGSLLPSTGNSFVESEIAEANRRADLLKLHFIKNAASREPAQQQLVDRICHSETGKLVHFFSTPEEFAALADRALLGWLGYILKKVRNRAGALMHRSLQVAMGASFSCLVLLVLVSILAVKGFLTPASAVACSLTLACGVAMALVMYLHNDEPPENGEKND